MQSTLVWKSLEFFGIEYVGLTQTESEIRVISTIIKSETAKPEKIEYSLTLTLDWQVKQLYVKNSRYQHVIQLFQNEMGCWVNQFGEEIPQLRGAVDVDLSCTPFTNSLPIKRLPWELNQPINLEMVYVDASSGAYRKVTQSYELLDAKEEFQLFHYKSGAFQSKILANRDGIVSEYPNLFALVSY
ncbi:hypothetical protein JOC54_000563 [Alkalihalobacillus xiaoxiensis]|uniref:Glycolipid-binding domain-containing protein n=1 Tax=Shouchella xiaoxiensis TaxID=766895 RepID=A0ABS2SP81_9BACI|nr:putative glycolipid-binding domain-containing protein [Shouchella xiaoxiensis]MBM7837332.1 hypothetical protein [Shouchella xiaoxiensis]